MSQVKNIFISFSGIDGSGKTTVAKKLSETLTTQGIDSRYVYGRIKPFFSKPLLVLGSKLFLRNTNMFDDYLSYSKVKARVTKRHNVLFRIYRSALLLDYSLQVLIKIKPYLILRKSVVCDRYIYDTLIADLSLNTTQTLPQAKHIINCLLCILPKPNLTFLIDLPEEVAYHRKTDTPSIEYLRQQRKMYIELANEYGMVVIDGLQTCDSLEAEVQRIVCTKIWPQES